MNQSHTAVARFVSADSADVYLTKIESGKNDMVILSSHIDDILGRASYSQPELSSAYQLCEIYIKQMTAFLG